MSSSHDLVVPRRGVLDVDASLSRRPWTTRFAYAAAVWSAAYGALGVHWTAGGRGFPFGFRHDASAHLSALACARREVAAPLIAALGLCGSLVAIAFARTWRTTRARFLLIGAGWMYAVGLSFVVPDARALAVAAYAVVYLVGATVGWSADTPFFSAITWPMLNQVLCVVGGAVWAAATAIYQRRATGRCERCGRGDRRARWSRPEVAARWGRWAVGIAAVIPAFYTVSRWAWVFGIPLGTTGEALRAAHSHGGVLVPAFGLGAVAVSGSILTFGLARRWGEVFPRWIPEIGGTRVPPAAAIVPAAVVSVAALSAGLTIVRLWSSGRFDVSGGNWIATVPMLLWPIWGLALGFATLAYYYRRRSRCAWCGRH